MAVAGYLALATIRRDGGGNLHHLFPHAWYEAHGGKAGDVARQRPKSGRRHLVEADAQLVGAGGGRKTAQKRRVDLRSEAAGREQRQ